MTKICLDKNWNTIPCHGGPLLKTNQIVGIVVGCVSALSIILFWCCCCTTWCCVARSFRKRADRDLEEGVAQGPEDAADAAGSQDGSNVEVKEQADAAGTSKWTAESKGDAPEPLSAAELKEYEQAGVKPPPQPLSAADLKEYEQAGVKPPPELVAPPPVYEPTDVVGTAK